MAAGLNLTFAEEQLAIQSAVQRFCTQHSVETHARQTGAPFPRELWRELAELGVFAPAAGDDESEDEKNGNAVTVCAIAEALGTAVFPGPVADTYLAIAVTEGDDRAGLLDGRLLVSVSAAGSSLLPLGTEADLFLVVDKAEISRAAVPQDIEPVETLGGEIWGRGVLRLERTLPNGAKGLLLGSIAAAAYLASLGSRLLRETSNYTRTRKQFGKALGSFQAVSHPLADCAIALTAAATLARCAAASLDGAQDSDGGQRDTTRQLASGALLSARRASLKTAFACHQAYGGIGITLAGPAFYISRRIRQLASQAPGGTMAQQAVVDQMGLGD